MIELLSQPWVAWLLYGLLFVVLVIAGGFAGQPGDGTPLNRWSPGRATKTMVELEVAGCFPLTIGFFLLLGYTISRFVTPQPKSVGIVLLGVCGVAAVLALCRAAAD